MNPALHTNCSTLASISPAVVQETLGKRRHAVFVVYCIAQSLAAAIAVEVFGKCWRNKPLLPLSTLNHFRLIWPKS